MAKEEGILVVGEVIEVLPSATFRVRVENMPNPVFAYISGKLRTNSINILLGDTVTLEISMYDLTKGRIIYRGISNKINK